MAEKKVNPIETRANFGFVRYANCWEDADILLRALQIKGRGNILSIASAGDNSLSLLSQNPDFVLAIDLNPTQLAATELKKIAFKHLSYEFILRFLGVHPEEKRKSIYSSLRKYLSSETATFWDSHLDLIEQGIIHIGKFEHYFQLFRRLCLPLIHSRKRIEALLRKKNKEERHFFYEKKWNNWRWNMLFKLFFSRKMMGRLGRDPEFFKYVETDVAVKILSRAKEGLTLVPTDENPYLEYILKGNFKQALPHYLRRENFSSIQKNIDRLILFKGDVAQAIREYSHLRFDGWNLSDIFEYMSPDEYEQGLETIIKASNPQARIAFWNMLCPRGEIHSLKDHLTFLHEESASLLREDKAFFYQAFRIGVVS